MFRFSALTTLRNLPSTVLGKRRSSNTKSIRNRSGSGNSGVSARKRTARNTGTEMEGIGESEAALAKDPTEETSSGTSKNFSSSREWIHTKLQTRLDDVNKANPQRGRGSQKDITFTVVSYNILAQDLLESHMGLYADNKPEHLDWDHRKTCLLKEIIVLRPDILCLQELQEDHVEEFSEALKDHFTFDRLFKKRTGSDKRDGCAIYYNPVMFEVLDTRTVEYNQNVALLDRDNVGIIVKLRSRESPDSVFLVATTHLLFNPKRHDVRLAQVQVLLAELEQMAHLRDGHCPIILTGDFNTVPNSTAFHLLTEGSLDVSQVARVPIIPNDLGITDNCQHVHSVKYGPESKESLLYHSEREQPRKRRYHGLHNEFRDLFNTGNLRHWLEFTTAVRDLVNSCSTYHDQWIVVDYLFYSRYFNGKLNRVIEGNLKLLSYLALPTKTDCERIGMIPNETFGSDHFSLAARFLLQSRGRK